MMGLFGFLRRGGRDGARDWQRAWERAVDGLDAGAPARLEAELAGRAVVDDDLEVEQEMLQALRDVLALAADLARGALPLIDTSHRAAAGERCHFSAPVSMPDDPAQPTGRLLLTSGRAAFAGGTRTPPLPWHAARQVVRTGRDLILVRSGAADGLRFRCNTFSDAVCAAALARHLMTAARKPV
jgi:hypothetical protein